MADDKRKRLNVFRYGMMVIPVVAWVITFSYLFLLSNFFAPNTMDALVPSMIWSLGVVAVVGVVCFAAYWAYKRFVLQV
jgi:hypothetical protein